MPYFLLTYFFRKHLNKTIATETIRDIVTVAIVIYKGLTPAVYRMLTINTAIFHSKHLSFAIPSAINPGMPVTILQYAMSQFVFPFHLPHYFPK